MQKNVAGQRWPVFAFGGAGHANEGEPITGDAANITANLRIDGGAANAVDDTNPTELEDGYYYFDITQAESNGDSIVICPESSTANVEVIGVPGAAWPRQADSLVATAASIAALNDAPAVSAVAIRTEIDSNSTQLAAIVADTNELQTDDIPGLIAALNDAPAVSAVAIRTEIDSNSTQLAAIVADSNELQTDWANGGRLDLILDTAAASSGGGIGAALTTTIATLASQTSFTLTAGSADDDAYNGWVLVVTDQSTSTQKALGVIEDYVGSTRTVTLETDPGIFTMATGDTVEVVPALATGGLSDQAKLDINTEVDTALSDYDAPTRAELTADINSVLNAAGQVVTGTLQSATATTAVLAASTSIADDLINWAIIYISSGTGAGQSRVIDDWVSSTDTATVKTWTTTPDNTSTYVVLAAPPTSDARLQSVNTEQMNGIDIVGVGTSGDKWRA